MIIDVAENMIKTFGTQITHTIDFKNIGIPINYVTLNFSTTHRIKTKLQIQYHNKATHIIWGDWRVI